jgi:beta-mannosidase
MKYFSVLLFSILLFACESDVDINNPLSINLNGLWQFRQQGQEGWTKAVVPGLVQSDMLRAGLIEDPFYGKNEEKIGWIELMNWEYERDFVVDAEMLKQDVVELVFEGLDTYAEVRINGQLMLSSDNMFCSWRIECKNDLFEGENTVSVLFKSPIKEKEDVYNSLGYQLPASNDAGKMKVSPFVRKAPFHFGWDWGPRIVTMGIWRPVRIEGHSLAKIKDVYFEQVSVEADRASLSTHISLDVFSESPLKLVVKDGNTVLVQTSLTPVTGQKDYTLDFSVENPKLWWSNGLGEPHRYNWTIELLANDKVIAEEKYKIGLRKIELVQESDSIGTNYYFKLNNVPVFMKGANYIPQDNFIPRVSYHKYEKLLNDAALANMNMLRVWGGGIYEDDIFYDLCDEKGIMVWQDFMFACSMYPGNDAFLDNVRKEIRQNVRRLRNYACIALWCGNNEVAVAWKYWGWQKEYGFSQKDEATISKNYKALFNELIPDELSALNTHRNYVPTSPLSNWGRKENFKHHSMHYWGVWHGDEPFENYKSNVGRFMSEYGFQSFPSVNSIKAFADSTQWHPNSIVMKHHQKSYIGNEMITKHLGQYYPQPQSFEEFVYFSQLTQAKGIAMAINAHRKNRHCMGTLYWQINDCWPGPSWSGIDYFGRWKALHYKVKELYRDIAVIVEPDPGNNLSVYLSSDRKSPVSGKLYLSWITFDGVFLKNDTLNVNLNAFQAKKILSLDSVNLINQYYSDKVVLRVLFKDSNNVYKQLHYFKNEKNLDLKNVKILKELRKTDEGYELTLSCPVLIKNLMIETDEGNVHCSDNFFDLMPNTTTRIKLSTYSKIKISDLKFMSINSIRNL